MRHITSSPAAREWLEPVAWCALALAAACGGHSAGEQLPYVTPDSAQYLSAAQCLRTRHRFETNLLHYDTERSYGIVPAPLTWYPPGYPAAIAFLSTFGLGYELAALWISIASFVAVTAGVWQTMRMLDPSLWPARAAVVCWIASSQALFFSGAALSESLFTLFGVAIALLMLRGSANRGAAWWWIGAAIVAGLSYWVRYAGALWVLASLGVIGARILLQKKQGPTPWTAAIAAAAALLVITPVMIRNVALVGDWRGGNNLAAVKPLSLIHI